MTKPEDPYNWIHQAVDQTFSDKDLEIGLGQKQLFAKTIIIGIDTSGSTDNRHGRGRGGGGVNKTDPIIVAEIRGALYYLITLSNIYNLIGVDIILSTFSSETRLVNKTTVASIDDFKNYLDSMSRMMTFDFRDTNLMSFLTSAFEKATSSAHIVLATDGQPNVGGDVNNILNFLKSVPFENFSIAIIGAGSIQSSIGGSSGIRTIRSKDKSVQYSLNGTSFNLQQLNKHFRFASSSECNIEFLLQIMEHFDSSVYLPSFGDYSKLKEVAVNYLSNPFAVENFSNFKTVLDDGKLAQLPLNVCQHLSIGKNCIAYLDVTKSWYLFTRKWQIALNSLSELTDYSRVFVPRGDFSLDFKVVYADDNFGVVEVESDGSFKFAAKVNSSGFPLCRQIVAVN